jgi:acetyl-CoA carboxylase carboxyl transferase subunit alpha
MALRDVELKIAGLKEQLASLDQTDPTLQKLRSELSATISKMQEEIYSDLQPYDKVYLARHQNRPNVHFYIDGLFHDFIELHGDRMYADDGAVIGGVATFNGTPVTVIGHVKGKTTEENIKANFGMPHPEGYRKAIRLAKQAEKFNRPIITFVDTPGAYPGIGAEERGQSEAIARSIQTFMGLTVPVVAIVIGEGGSGGALALSGANHLVMLEHSVYSVLSPEGFASILYKDSTRAEEAAGIMKLTADDLLDFRVIDEIVAEPVGGAHANPDAMIEPLRDLIGRQLTELSQQNGLELRTGRYNKFQQIGRLSV